MVNVVASTSDITADWITAALKENNLLQSGIAEFQLKPIGQGVGLMGELGRLHLTYERDEDLPSTMIAKCAAQNENRAVAQTLDFYNREVNFYNRIGAESTLNVPASYYGAVNQDTYDCVLLMEDLGDVSPRDQITGASAEEAITAIERVAAMHAKFRGKVDDDASSWMYDFMSTGEGTKLQTMLYLPAVESMIEKFPQFFDESRRTLVRRVGERYPMVWSHSTADNTFIHGDYRQDNLLYKEGSNDAKVMDWQISGKGKGIFDVTYFLGQSVPSATRKEVEKELLLRYVARLHENGVPEYSFEQCWDDYRMLLLSCLIFPATVCGTLDLANERGKALAECMLERSLTAIDQLGCGALLE